MRISKLDYIKELERELKQQFSASIQRYSLDHDQARMRFERVLDHLRNYRQYVSSVEARQLDRKQFENHLTLMREAIDTARDALQLTSVDGFYASLDHHRLSMAPYLSAGAGDRPARLRAPRPTSPFR